MQLVQYPLGYAIHSAADILLFSYTALADTQLDDGSASTCSILCGSKYDPFPQLFDGAVREDCQRIKPLPMSCCGLRHFPYTSQSPLSDSLANSIHLIVATAALSALCTIKRDTSHQNPAQPRRPLPD